MNPVTLNKSRIARINSLVCVLKKEEPELLETELQRIYLMLKVKTIEGTALENNITMDEIVEEVNIVRQERYENQNCI